jgi:hypothetical protein
VDSPKAALGDYSGGCAAEAEQMAEAERLIAEGERVAEGNRLLAEAERLAEADLQSVVPSEQGKILG